MSEEIRMRIREVIQTGGGSDDVWLPNVSEEGVISWSKSASTTPPTSRNIKGETGETGAPGADGEDGLGIKSVDINASNHLIVTYDDDTTHDAGEIDVTVPIDDTTPASNKVYSSEKVESMFTTSNILRGKKWCACGDSFTAGDFYGYVDPKGHSGTESDAYDPEMGMYKTYPWWIAKRNNMTLAMIAKSGNDFTNISGATRPFSNSSSSENYTQIPADADYVTIWFGLNEYNLTEEQIGTKADTTNATLWGAYRVVFNSILTNNPFAKIGVFISDGQSPGAISQEYHDALIDICKYWAIPYLDLRNGLNVPMGIGGRLDDCNSISRIKRKEAFQVSPTNLHPNVKAHEYRSTFIEEFLRSL